MRSCAPSAVPEQDELAEAVQASDGAVASKLAVAAIQRGELDFLLGPVTDAYDSAVNEHDDETAAECVLGLGFLDSSGTGFSELVNRATRAERDDLIESGFGDL